MKAILMAGGFGTRMRPLTIKTPKPMVPIGNLPIMEHVVSLLARHGITEITSLLYFSPDNSLAANAEGGRVSIFSTEGWVLGSSYGFADPYSNVNPRDFTLGGDILAVVDRNNIVFLETFTGEELFTLPSECDIRFSPNGPTLLTWCYQGELKIWGVIP